MFRAITKDSARAPNANSKGTLSALWGKKSQSKLNDGAAQPGDRVSGGEAAQEESIEPATAAVAASERTPEPAPRENSQELQMEEAAEAAVAAPALGDDLAGVEPANQDAPAREGAVVPVDGETAEEDTKEQASQQSDKKQAAASASGKKRGRGDDISAEQLPKLEALFAASDKGYPSVAARQALAEELGVEVALLTKWFEKKRKRVRGETGEPAKRGRPKKNAAAAAAGSGPATAKAGAGSKNPAIVAAAAAPANCAGDAAPAEEAATAEAKAAAISDSGDGKQQLEAEEEREKQSPAEPVAAQPSSPGHAAMEVDAGAVGAGMAGQQAEQEDIVMVDLTAEGAPGATSTPANLANPKPSQQEQVTPVNLEIAGGTTEAGLAAGGAAAQPAAAATAAPPAAPAAAGAEEAAGAAEVPASNVGMAPTSAAPEQHVLSAEEKLRLMEELREEAQQLQRDGLAAPLSSIPSGLPHHERLPLCDSKLAGLVGGQRLPLSALVAALLPVFRAAEGAGASPDEATLRVKILDIATRKAVALKDGGSSLPDRLEDDTASHLWQWEVRDSKLLPKDQRPAAVAIKRRGNRVHERLAAVGNALKHLETHKDGPAAPKLNRALEGLRKAKTLEQLAREQEEESTGKGNGKKAAAGPSAAKPKLTEEEKARLQAEKEAEKERLRAEKDAEKERAKAEKEAEKDKAKAEKEAEKEQKKAEKEAERERKKHESELKKTGFRDERSLAKTQTFFASFLKKTPNPTPPASTPSAAAAGTAAAAASPCCSPERQDSPGASQAGRAQRTAGTAGATPATTARGGLKTGGATTVKKRERSFWERHPPNDELQANVIMQPNVTNSMDAALEAAAAPPAAGAGNGSPLEEQLVSNWRLWMAQGKQSRLEARQNKVLGLPAPWKRVVNAREVAQQRLQELLDTYQRPLSEVVCVRRQLLLFNGNLDGKRPAHYGVRYFCSKGPLVRVRPRNFLARYSLPGSYLSRHGLDDLNYEEESDLEWEVEPEGEGLEEDEKESEVPDDVSEGGQDSFVVETGYLSEDEGIQSDLLDDTEADSGEAALGAHAPGALAADYQEREAKRRRLEIQLERLRRCKDPRPYIISRLRQPDTPEGQPPPFVAGDVSLLEGLAMEVLVPGGCITMPPDPAAEAAAAAGPAAGPAPGLGDTPAAKVAKTSKAEAATAPKSGGGGATTGGKLERPEELLPELVGYLHTEPKLSKAKVVEKLLEAHKERRIVKKWVSDKIKELADWKGSQWVLRPQALEMLAEAPPAPAAVPPGGPAAPAVPAGEVPLCDVGMADAVAACPEGGEDAAASAPAPPAAAAARAAAGADTAAAAAASAAQITPVTAVSRATAGPLDRFLTKKGPKTPLPPSALKPQQPPSVKAPNRLATSMAGPGSAAPLGKAGRPLPTLTVPDEVSGTADHFWLSLQQHIEGAEGACASQQAQHAPQGAGESASWQFEAAFAPDLLAKLAGAMPAFVMSALVTGLASSSITPSLRACYARCLAHAAATLSQRAAGTACGLREEEHTTISQQVWATSSTCPVPASLQELCHEPLLVPALRACLEALATQAQAVDRGVRPHQQREQQQGAAERAAARAALEVAALLLAEDGLRQALVEAGGGGSSGALVSLRKAATVVVSLPVWGPDAPVQELADSVEKGLAGLQDGAVAMETDS